MLLLISWVEVSLLAAKRPGLVEQLARGGAARHLERLAGRAQVLVEGPDGGIVLGGAQGGHGQRGAQASVAVVADRGLATDAAPRLARHGCQPGVGGEGVGCDYLVR